ncbi:MAG: hypothetical protein AAGG75_24795 [Bacteroidota bacterium]
MKNGWLKGSSLFYALLISILIALICTALISVAYYNRLLNEYDRTLERLLRNAESGMQWLQAAEEREIPARVFDLYGDGQDSVKVKKEQWGLFYVAHCEAFQRTLRGHSRSSRSGLLGSNYPAYQKMALYLQDNFKPLTLSGLTRIEGIAFVPQAGVKSGYVDGTSFQGEQLIAGERRLSNRGLPPTVEPMLQRLEAQFGRRDSISSGFLPDTLQQSFGAPTQFFRARRFDLGSQRLSGNICLIADSLVTIGRGAQLEDILIFAPSIQVEAGFEGSVQLFAQQQLDIGRGAQLRYPSVAMLIPSNVQTRPSLRLAKEASLSGMLMIYSKQTKNAFAGIKLETNSTVEGLLYANTSLELSGSILGTAICSGFILRTAASAYDNHLFNTRIIAPERSPHYIAPAIMAVNGTTKIAKWLD